MTLRIIMSWTRSPCHKEYLYKKSSKKFALRLSHDIWSHCVLAWRGQFYKYIRTTFNIFRSHSQKNEFLLGRNVGSSFDNSLNLFIFTAVLKIMIDEMIFPGKCLRTVQAFKRLFTCAIRKQKSTFVQQWTYKFNFSNFNMKHPPTRMLPNVIQQMLLPCERLHTRDTFVRRFAYWENWIENLPSENDFPTL